MPELKDWTGQRFGRLIALSFAERRGRRYLWRFLCDCGSETLATIGNVLHGTKSCGCLRRELATSKAGFVHLTHGQATKTSETLAYRSWRAMKRRCLNPSQDGYRSYGAKGVTICERWLNSFENFFADMGERLPGMTLDRIDPYGHYEPGNCRWADRETQLRNKRL